MSIAPRLCLLKNKLLRTISSCRDISFEILLFFVRLILVIKVYCVTVIFSLKFMRCCKPPNSRSGSPPAGKKDGRHEYVEIFHGALIEFEGP
jgi:hypothetical protein